MIVFPNCKINLGLRILRKREDGYHDLETVFYPLPFYDVLEVIKDADPISQAEVNHQNKKAVQFSMTGFSIDGKPDDNICIKAYRLLKKDFPALPALKLHLHKIIPIGAGLGGGSADAVYTLKLLNDKFDLKLSSERLGSYALRLGSDCPFFIINKPCFATGRGELLDLVAVDLSAYKFILVNPGIPISTAIAFSGITPALPGKSIKEIIQQPVDTWRTELVNDFENTVFGSHPEIKAIKNKMYDAGAVYTSMSGSGSSVYGIFEKETAVKLNFHPGYFMKELVS